MASKTSSYRARVKAERQREQDGKSQWDGSTTSERRKMTTEDRIA